MVFKRGCVELELTVNRDRISHVPVPESSNFQERILL